MLDVILGGFICLCVLKGIKAGPIFGFAASGHVAVGLLIALLYSETWAQAVFDLLPLFSQNRWHSFVFLSIFFSSLLVYFFTKQVFKLIPFIKPKGLLSHWLGALMGSLYAFLFICSLIIPLEQQFPKVLAQSSVSQWISFQIRPILIDIKKLRLETAEEFLQGFKQEL